MSHSSEVGHVGINKVAIIMEVQSYQTLEILHRVGVRCMEG